MEHFGFADKFLIDINKKVDAFVKSLPEANSEQLGLDPRAGHGLRVAEDAIIVPMGSDDRTMQYYGGFEYVARNDASLRKEYGRYAFYFVGDSDDRVLSCISAFELQDNGIQLKDDECDDDLYPLIRGGEPDAFPGCGDYLKKDY